MDDNKPSRAAGLLTVGLGVELKRDWLAWCQEHDLVPGPAVKALVETAMAEGHEPKANLKRERAKVSIAKIPDRGPKVSRELQFTPSENAAIAAVAKAQGFGFQDWVISAVRAALAKAPAFGQVEMEALVQSNQRLTQLVIELGALRRAGVGSDLAADLTRVEAELKSHVEMVSVAMAKGAQRWQLKV